jgi:hypothetical protein
MLVAVAFAQTTVSETWRGIIPGPAQVDAQPVRTGNRGHTSADCGGHATLLLRAAGFHPEHRRAGQSRTVMATSDPLFNQVGELVASRLSIVNRRAPAEHRAPCLDAEVGKARVAQSTLYETLSLHETLRGQRMGDARQASGKPASWPSG